MEMPGGKRRVLCLVPEKRRNLLCDTLSQTYYDLIILSVMKNWQYCRGTSSKRSWNIWKMRLHTRCWRRKTYKLVHAGIRNFSEDKDLDEYNL